LNSPSEAGLETLLRRDRLIVITALSALALLAWAYVIHLAAQMEMGGMDMTGYRMATTGSEMVMLPASQPWTATEFIYTLVMWVIMMIGMMIPSAAPIILLYARVGRHAIARGKPFASTGWFLSGYLIAWTGFSVAATTAQWILERARLLTPAMAGASATMGSVVLITAGVYQWTRLKESCLTQCRSPIEFVQRNGGFRQDSFGSLRLGMAHGIYCVGCCWALMALLFVGGIMNVLWIAAIAILVLAEKVLPGYRMLPRLAGSVLIVAGLWGVFY
jgi:predicted metal-binding membrane protein